MIINASRPPPCARLDSHRKPRLFGSTEIYSKTFRDFTYWSRRISTNGKNLGGALLQTSVDIPPAITEEVEVPSVTASTRSYTLRPRMFILVTVSIHYPMASPYSSSRNFVTLSINSPATPKRKALSLRALIARFSP